MKKVFTRSMMIFSILFLMISITGTTSFASKIDNTDEFIELVKKTDYFLDYKELLVSETPYILKEVTKEDSLPNGFLVQYEIKYNYALQGEAKLTSILSIVYTKDTEELSAAIIDYSKVLTEKNVYIIDLKTNQEHFGFSVGDNENYNGLEKEINKKLDAIKLSNNTNQASTPLYCWYCTQTQSYGGNIQDECNGLVGTLCRYGAKTIYTKLVCNASIVILCYVPQYTLCVDGYWSSNCYLENAVPPPAS